jgi:hypothetical protein
MFRNPKVRGLLVLVLIFLRVALRPVVGYAEVAGLRDLTVSTVAGLQGSQKLDAAHHGHFAHLIHVSRKRRHKFLHLRTNPSLQDMQQAFSSEKQRSSNAPIPLLFPNAPYPLTHPPA